MNLKFIPSTDGTNPLIIVEHDENKNGSFSHGWSCNEYLNYITIKFDMMLNWVNNIELGHYYKIIWKDSRNSGDTVYSDCHLHYKDIYRNNGFLIFHIHDNKPKKFLFYLEGEKSEKFISAWKNRDCWICQYFFDRFEEIGQVPKEWSIVCHYNECGMFGEMKKCEFFKLAVQIKYPDNDNTTSGFIGQKTGTLVNIDQ